MSACLLSCNKIYTIQGACLCCHRGIRIHDVANDGLGFGSGVSGLISSTAISHYRHQPSAS